MKNHKPMSRRQWMLAACMLMLLGGVGVVPWRVVAQEAETQTTNAREAKAESAPLKPEQAIVGVWRGGPGGTDEIVIDQDGTYAWHEEIPRATNAGLAFGHHPSYQDRSGRWSIQDDGSLALVFDKTIPTLRGLPPPAAADPASDIQAISEADRTTIYGIIKLDATLLRMKGDVSRPVHGGSVTETWTYFFRRVDNEKLSDATKGLPPDARRFAELIKFDADEAKAFGEYFQALSEPTDGKVARFDLLEKIVAAKRRKIDFAELFDLTPEEAEACGELLKLAKGPLYPTNDGDRPAPPIAFVEGGETKFASSRFGKALRLADQGQLTGSELSAINKLKKFEAELEATSQLIQSPLVEVEGALARIVQYQAAEQEVQKAAKHEGLPVPPNTASQAEVDAWLKEPGARMLRKLVAFVRELEYWMNATVFTS